MFTLDARLQQDCYTVGDLPLSTILLMNDCQYPWMILVPRVVNATEIIDLNEQQQQQLWQESALISKCLQNCFAPDKLNIAALGNMVPQLHMHHVARFKTDVAWPKPIWGMFSAKPYAQELHQQTIDKIKTFLGERI